MKPIIETLKTVGDYVRYAVTEFEKNSLFYGHGTDNAWDEAHNLILLSLHLPISGVQDFYNARLTFEERELLLNRIQERISSRKPIAYLLNRAWFAGMEFYVDERVLVPRSPIAELIENYFSPWMDGVEVESIADIGTGSGCIACALATYFPEAQVDAIDISLDALSVAKENVKRHGLEERVNCIQSNLLTQIPATRRYQLMVSNPPYVDAKAMSVLPSEFRMEPELGLAGGEDGLDLVIPLMKQAIRHLDETGILIVEVGHSQEALIKRFPTIPFTWLSFEHGGEGVFLLTAQDLEEHASVFM